MMVQSIQIFMNFGEIFHVFYHKFSETLHYLFICVNMFAFLFCVTLANITSNFCPSSSLNPGLESEATLPAIQSPLLMPSHQQSPALHHGE